MGELMSVLDGLAADDLHAFSDRQKLDRVTVLLAVKNRLDAELSRSVRSASCVRGCQRYQRQHVPHHG